MKSFTKIEKYIGSLKFAIILISLFTIAMIIGTFFESYYGTDFANRTVYKTVPFMLIQFMMGISILYAAYLRLPPKKRLYGFYTIHAGLILIIGGSVVTYIAGIDGNITLPPLSPKREIKLNEDIFKVTNLDTKEVTTYDLPNTAFEKVLNAKNGDLTLENYLPYSDKTLKWVQPSNKIEKHNSSQYFLSNDNVSEKFILSLHPEAFEFKSNLKLGPLNIHYLPTAIAPCFGKKSESKIILWDSVHKNCFTPEEQKLKIQTTETGKRFLVLKSNQTLYSFFPELSPFPLDKDLNVMKDSPFRIFSKKVFEKDPNLFLFGEKVAYFSEDRWVVEEFDGRTPLPLPWMGFEIILTQHEESKIPAYVPVYNMPIQKNNKLIAGTNKAIKVNALGKKYWIRDDQSITLRVRGEKLKLELEKKSLRLPYEVSLTRFKMDTDPGTNSPASYESFIQLFTKEGPSDHHLFMNNPLKYEGLTFYQASYFDTGQGQYGSVLSVNYDPGRPIKYLGSLLLTLGSFWHFYLRRKKTSKKEINSKAIKVTA
tara:strand:+ start:49 stop:1665 length:1617 start_codon:yes stop_codon:yes gene_type:complete